MNKGSKLKCGIVSIVGSPNTGKSTLLNNILNEKISIISHKVQTTRTAIRGILNIGSSQIIFIDTPGLLKPRTFLDKNMTRSITQSILDSDINIFLCDITKKNEFKDNKLFKKIIFQNKKNFLVINKIDLVEKSSLLASSYEINDCYDFQQTFMISALKNKGTRKLVSNIKKNIPERDWLYEESIKTDQKLDFILSEITREKIFQLLNEELPYSIKIMSKIYSKNNFLKIYQNIIVNKKSQKPIIIGKNGKKIKEIGIRARKDMEKKLNKKIYLDILVSVQKPNSI
ncbi:GTPase Era [Rickettsiales bacterium]|nr:GTPase Era [Rickettsiales bacterium]